MLKWIALALMLVDHFAYIMAEFIPHEIYITMRILGRLSFPVFVYYVVLGLGRTSNLKVYMKRLLLFALLSEVVIRTLDMLNNPYGNVIFSLFLYGLFYILMKNRTKEIIGFEMNNAVRYIIMIALVFVVPYVEYGYYGAFIFFGLYYVNEHIEKSKKSLYAAGAITLAFIPGFLISGISPIQLFAGLVGFLMFTEIYEKRIFSAKIEKWTFYWVYPLQWILFAVIYYLYFLFFFENSTIM